MPGHVPRYLLNNGYIHCTPVPGAPIMDWSMDALLLSEPHFKLSDGTWSGGGPLYVWKRKVSHTSNHISMTLVDNTWSNRPTGCVPAAGYSIPPRPPLALKSSIPAFSTELPSLKAAYATGYARARPGNPVAGVGQFLAELRDLPKLPFKKAWTVPITQLPKILFQMLKDFRNLGSEYLNVAFGWKPFVKDLQDMYYLWKTIDKRMAQLIRENGHYIRRRATIETDVSSTSSSQGFAAPFARVTFAPPNWPKGNSQVTTSVTTTTKVWFVGAFRYYIPDTGSSMWDARARLALFGALPTPELIWNVLPWSWLIDWFGNVGDIISNASTNAVDNLTTRYSFVMKHVTETVEASCQSYNSGEYQVGSPPVSVAKNWPSNSFTYRSTQVTEKKMRTGGGNPFGLDVQLSSLSAYQLSILAALGISRGAVR